MHEGKSAAADKNIWGVQVHRGVRLSRCCLLIGKDRPADLQKQSSLSIDANS